MTKTIAYVCLLIILVALDLWPRQEPASEVTPPSSADNCEIAGTVTSAETGQPLANAEVRLRQVPGAERAGPMALFNDVTATDSSGHFDFQGLPPGNYMVNIRRDGFLPRAYTRGPRHGALGSMFLTPGTKSTDLVVPLKPASDDSGAGRPAGSVTGRVTDQEGQLLVGAVVSAMRVTYSATGVATMTQLVTGRTNSQGEYHLPALPPGTYFLRARYELPAAISPHGVSGQTSAPVYIYPGGSDPGRGAQVHLSAGEKAPGVDLSVKRMLTYGISGTVESAIPGYPASTIMLMLFRAKGEVTSNEPLPQVSNIGGSVEALGLLPGSYVLWAIQRGPEGEFYGHVPLEVKNGDVDIGTLVVERGSDIAGHVLVEGQTEDLSGCRVSLESSDNMPFGRAKAEIEKNGSFVLKNVSWGKYLLTLSGLSPGSYLEQAKLGARDVRLHLLDVPPGGTSDTFELKVSTHGANVKGTVLTSGAIPAEGSTVVLVPQPPLRGVVQLYRSASTDPSGRFSLDGIAPGAYKLFAWNQIPRNAWLARALLKRFEGQSVKVQLAAGERKALELRVIPGLVDVN